MVYAISYANEAFKNAQKYGAITAQKNGADKVIEYGPSNIDDVFYDKNEEILKCKRGNGYWLWKPYIIDKTMEHLDENDWVVYSDSGVFYNKNIDEYIKHYDRNGLSVIVQDTKFAEKQFNKKYVLEAMDCYNEIMMESKQISATVLIIKCNDIGKEIVKKWLDIAQNELMITDIAYGENQDGFIEHRHDQSICSLVLKQYNDFVIHVNDLFCDIIFPWHKRALMTYHHSNSDNMCGMYLSAIKRLFKIIL